MGEMAQGTEGTEDGVNVVENDGTSRLPRAWYLKMLASVLAALVVGLGIYLMRRSHPDPVPSSASILANRSPSPSSPSPAGSGTGSSPKLSDASRIQLLTTYERALMYSRDQQNRQKELCDADPECKQSLENAQKAVLEWNQIAPQIVLKEKLPTGTGFNVDVSTGTVNVVVPGGAGK